MRPSSPLSEAKKHREIARAKLETVLIERRLSRLDAVQGRYDVLDGNNSKKRRTMTIETQNEEQIMRPYDRMKAINLARDLERNFTGAKAIIKQFKINVVGNQGKIRLNLDDKDLNKNVSAWFNGYWAKNCDSRDDLHFSDILQLIIRSVLSEGDVLVAFDDFDRNDGRLLIWEADQLVKIDETDWINNAVKLGWYEDKNVGGKKAKVPLLQESGVIYDSKGRVRAYAVTGRRGVQVSKLNEATILSKDSARLLKNPFRFNQLRGVGDLLAASADLEDIYEMRAKELQSAKVASTMAGYTASDDSMDEALLRGGVAPEALLETASATAQATPKTSYERFETLTGGNWEYLAKGDEIKVLDFQRPNIAVKDFFDFVLSSAGSGFGLANCYATLRAQTSYTAYRGEMIMTWRTFEAWQKWLERHFCDWIAGKAIGYAILKRLLPALPVGWQGSISWIWPVMPQVDPVNETNAIREKLKLAITDYAEVLGPDWEEKITKLKEQIKIVRDGGELEFLSLFETKAGAPAVDNKPVKKEDE